VPKKTNLIRRIVPIETAVVEVPNSSRLQYELMSVANAPDLMFELDQDPEVMRFINGGKPTSREEIQDRFIPRLEKYRLPEKGWGLWATP